ncbi:nuclear pore complex protein Nup98-Nup96 [Galendromus occidentalis]|uniref:Nuclear pore complex protein Nup98-Nup96 n=1 Tax=Galendromus occidentalis TaxID=34638 RepID=A0AAJ7SGE2_9ACAR|nr:nuclear pore complex protein Nup98-Nup96 [Galendromus occidentalis]
MFGQQQNKPFGFGTSSFGQSTGFGQPQTSVFGQTSTFGTPATQSGGLFGQSTSTFGAPQQPQQNTSFFGSTQPSTQSSLFGQPQQTQTQANAFGTSAFGSQNRPTFGGFGSTTTSTAGTSLFGQQNTTTTGSLFGQAPANTSVFAQSGFGAGSSGIPTPQFKPTIGNDTMIKSGTTINIQTKHQCITCMKEFENKSIEELRVDDYLANRKFGNQNQASSFGAPTTSNTSSLFGQTNTNTNTGFSFTNNNQPKLFGGTATSTFGTPAAPGPFGSTTSTANTSVFGQSNATPSFGGFGNTTAPKPAFGFNNTATPTATTQAATPFGAPKPFGATTPAFGTSTASPFGATTSQAKPAVSFGTPTFNTSNFGNRGFGTTGSTFGAPAPTSSTFTFGPTTTTQSNNIFGAKPTTTSAPFSFTTPTTGSMFNSAPPATSQPFGSFGTPALGSTFGATPGTGFFNSSATNLGGQNQSSNLSDEIARNRQHIMMISLPLGGDPFFKCEVKKDPIRPTSLAAQKSILERTVKPNTPPAPKAKVIPVNRSVSHASLFAGLEDGDNSALGPSPKMLTIRPKMPECFSSPSIFQPSTSRNTSLEVEKPPEPAALAQTQVVEEPCTSSPPIHSTPYNPKTRLQSPVRQDMNPIPEEESSLQLAPEKSILHGTEEPSPENENSIGVKCTRHDYYTKPALNTLKLDRNGDCFVENFIIGRKDFGHMVVLGKMNIANLNIDETVLFRRKEITVYPDESNKPPVGQGLNRKAEITLESVYPLNRGTRDVMRNPQQLIDSKFRDKLESYTLKMGAIFLDYDEYTGVWVFRVDHFSRYGLLDDDDDDVDGGRDVAMTETRPLQTLLTPAVVPNPKEKQPRQSMDITQVEMPSNYIFSPASIQVCQAMQLDNNMLQGMKASFFVDECDENEYSWAQYQPKVPSFGAFKQNEIEEKKLRMSPPHDRVQTQIALRPKKPLRVSLQTTDEFLKKFDKIPMIRPEIDNLEQNRVVNAAAGFQRISVPEELSVFSRYPKSFLNELATCNRTRLRPSLHHWTLVRPSEKVETRSLNITIPGFSKNASSVCFERIDMLPAEETLMEMMSVQFANSEMTADLNGMPLYSPIKGVELMQNHIKRLERHETILEVELSNTLQLCDALWGNGVSDVLDRIETEAARKRALSMWITRVTEDVVRQEVSSSENSLERIFSYLSGHQISAACEEAVSKSDYNLATILAQAAHDQTTKMIVREMHVEWTQSKKDLHINPERLRLYAVMAGLPEWTLSDGKQVNVCEGLDWLRCFALHLWYICPSNLSIAEVLADYLKATETYATPPEVKHGEREMSPLHVCFQLMSLYTDRTRSIDKMLCPDTVLGVRSQLEYRHCWLLGQVLQSLQYNVPCMKELHVRMASQLESQGLWQWAVFALLHIEDVHQRQKYVYDLVCRHASASVELTENETFVQNRLKVPKEILYKAKALRASFEQRRVNQTKLLILADELNEAHEILVNHIAVKAIINEQFDLLRDLLHKMSQNFTKIQSWNQKGRVYYNYIQLRSILKDILDTKEDEEAIERILEGKYLEGVLASLSSKLARLPRDTVEQRLCQIEMAKTTFAAYKNVLTSKSASDPHLKNSAVRAVFQLLRTLPLPEDTVAQEFRRLSEEYPEYLPRD